MESRFKPTSIQDHTTLQSTLHAAIQDSRKLTPKGALQGPFGPWIESPELGKHLSQLGAFHRFSSCLDRRQIELAILLTAKFWRSQFEWWAHAPMAATAGVPGHLIQAILDDTVPTFTEDRDAAVYHFVLALHQNHQVEASTYQQAIEQLGQQGVIELIGLCGYYTTVSMTLNALEIPLPEGEQPPFA